MPTIGWLLPHGGSFSNSGKLTGSAVGVESAKNTAKISNTGTVTGTNEAGVLINDPTASAKGTVTNSGGKITGANGVEITGFGTILNSATITATSGTGATIGGGGSVTNNASATITGVARGVEIDGKKGAKANSLTNDSSIKATDSNGIAVSMGDGGKIDNNAGATITGGYDGIATGSRNVTLTNLGTITGTTGYGVTINDPAATNKASVTNSDIITGANGVAISGEGKVTNSKTITATVGTGVTIGDGGSVTNEANATITAITRGVEIDGGKTAGNSLTNDGSIKATGTGTGVAVSMGDGGKIENNSGATITGAYDGVSTGNGSVTLTNAGTITGTSGYGVTINDPAATQLAILDNQNTITGANGVAISGRGRVTNTDVITATVANGVVVGGGGSIVNGAGAKVQAISRGVELDGGDAVNSLTNSGSIAASATTGVGATMGRGGTVTNNAGATISGGYDGLASSSGTTRLTNAGSITGKAGYGVIINGVGIVTNSEAISGASGVAISGHGAVTNSGTITATSGTGLTIGGGGTLGNASGAEITGVGGGVEIDSGGNVTNNGTITGSGSTADGVKLGAGGSVENLSVNSVISGGDNGIAAGSGGVVVVNAGQITGTNGVGVEVNGAATVTNIHSISGGGGIEISGAGHVTNTATIRGTSGVAVAIDDGGVVTNASTGSITGVTGGVEIEGAGGSVTNEGSITASGQNSDGVMLGDGGKITNEGSGAKISGADNGVSAGSGNLTLANSGAISGGAGTGVTSNGNVTITNSKTITGVTEGVGAAQNGHVTNSGAIKASASSGVAISVDGTGGVVNEAGGSITGGAEGVLIEGAGATLSNAATISASATSSYGVRFASSGAVRNLAGASISGGAYGVFIGGAGTVQDSGSISGAVGVALTGAGTIVDDGSISSTKGASGTAVSLGGAGSTFELAYHAGLSGGIAGFEAGDTLVLGDNGLTITGYARSAGPAGMTALTLLDGHKAVVTVDLVGNFLDQTFNVKAIGDEKAVAVTLGAAPTTVTVAGFESEEASLNALPNGFDIADTAANIQAGLANIEADAGHVDAIRSTGAIVTVAGANLVADETALNEIIGGFNISGDAAGVQSDLNAIEADVAHVHGVAVTSGTVAVSVAAVEADQLALEKLSGFVIRDSAADVSGAIEEIEALEKGGATIKAITFTDSGTPTLDLSQTEVTNEANLLAKIVGAYDLDVTVSGHPFDEYEAQFSAAHKLLGETFLMPGPTPGQIALPAVTSQIQLAVGDFLGATLSGFKGADTIDFQGVAYASTDYVTFAGNANGGTVAIDDASGDMVAQFAVSGAYNASNFTLSADASNHLVVGWRTGIAHNTVDDFNFDGVSDALWLDSSSSELVDWSMANGAFSASQNIATAPAGSRFVGTGDFTGNGTSDILLQNTTSGQVTEWDLVDGAHSASHTLGAEAPSTNWAIAGTGDFNGDGQSDVLWFNSSSGDAMVWTVRNDAVASSRVIDGPGAGWSVLGVGDFNGDGVSDVLWENSTTHDLIDWQMKNGQLSAAHTLSGPAVSGTYLGAGDFLGNGVDDPLFESANGTLSAWQMSNGQYVGPLNLGIKVPSGFSEAAIGNFTGGATSDVLIHDPTTGVAEIGIVSGGKISGWTAVGSATPASWKLIA
jgi:hypothetical protein